jgi:cell division protein FtsI (penicillin-binding protein 3)
MSLLNRWNKTVATIVSSKGESLQIARTRLKIVRVICLFLFILVIIRLGDLTLLQNPKEPDSEYVTSSTIDNAERADIVDRNGELLATSLQVMSLYADPTLIDNKPLITSKLEEILKTNDIDEKLNKKGRFIWIKRGITPDEHYAINALGSPGLAFQRETRRFYPQGRTMAHLVGYTSVDGKGLSGIELAYNDRLNKGGEPLVLNTDIRLQYALAKALRNKMTEFNAIAATGGVVDIETGEVLAAVSLPDFDPHHAGKASENAKFNRFALGVYEMGSTFKLFSTANYIEVTGNPLSTTFDATKPLKEGRFTINDYHAEKRVLSLPEVFVHSSNIGSALMGIEIGGNAMRDFYTDLGFADIVKTDFTALGKPLFPHDWKKLTTMTASFGHGIAVSPLHVLQSTATIANGGVMPYLSFAKRNKDINKIETRILSASTAYKMKQLLRLNVTFGSGGKAEVAGYNVGGKTGTSEKSSKYGYDKNKLLSSFIAVFPTDKPKYAVLAIIDEPKGTKASYGYATGGWTGAPAVGNIIADMVRILGIPPEPKETKIAEGLEQYLTKTKRNFSPVNFEQR